MTQGKAYLVGTGPGDPGLITLKGHRLIREADVILYDHLIPFDLLELAKPGAEAISVGKFASRHTLPQEGINALLVEKALEGKNVVRLKGGDCYLFGRGGEEVQACVEAGVPFEVVPGITSALAVPCYAGIPPTHRDFTPHVAIVTGHRKQGESLEIPKAGTVVLLMSVANIPNIIDKLLANGWDATTPIAAIEHGTCYDQRTIPGTLKNFLERANEAKLRTPAIFIVGNVVSLRDQLDWFERRKNVLVLGNHPERYAYLGNIVHRRLIHCVGTEDTTELDSLLDNPTQIDWMVFTSVHGAKHLFKRLFELDKDIRCFGTVKIAAIGKATAERLKEFGIYADLVADQESSAGLVDVFSQQEMQDKHVLYPCAKVVSQELPEGLTRLGATVHQAAVYQTLPVEPGDVDFDYIDKILFTSGSTVRAFVERYGQVREGIQCLALGEPTQRTAQEAGISAEIVPAKV